MSYQPIGNYGIIATCAQLPWSGMNGSIDRNCYPQFDSPSIFGAILDDKRGAIPNPRRRRRSPATSRSIGLPPNVVVMPISS